MWVSVAKISTDGKDFGNSRPGTPEKRGDLFREASKLDREIMKALESILGGGVHDRNLQGYPPWTDGVLG